MAPTKGLPQRWNCQGPCLGQSGSELASTVGNKLANALTELYCLDPACHFCVGGSNGELVEGKLRHREGQWKRQDTPIPSRPSQSWVPWR